MSNVLKSLIGIWMSIKEQAGQIDQFFLSNDGSS